jgi:hypothetical protein
LRDRSDRFGKSAYGSKIPMPVLNGRGRGLGGARLISVLFLVVMGSLALVASSASAAVSHPYTGSSFGPDGVGGTESFMRLQAVTVDQETGDIYAYDAGAEKIYKFDAAGAPEKFSGLPANAIEHVGSGGGGAENELAVAPAGAPGGTGGDIYLANNSQGIQVYSGAGASLGELPQSGETCGVAVDAAGNVYAGLYPQTIRRFTPSANPPLAADKTGEGVAEVGVCNVAVGASEHIYAANYGGSGLYELEGIGDTTPTKIDPAANTMAVSAGGNLYADRVEEVAEYGPVGNLIGHFGQGDFTESHGVASNADETKIYVAAPTQIRVYGATATVPDAITEPATAVTKASVTLNAHVGAAGGSPTTSCVFQYTTREHYGSSRFTGAAEANCSPGGPFSGAGTTAVSGTATGLQIETEYVYRVVVGSTAGTNSGEVLSFTTPGAVNLETGAATAITNETASLNGTINPEGTAVEECSFEYGTTTSYGHTAPCAEDEAEIATGNAPVAVHADVSELVGGTVYHFRLIAKSHFGTSKGADAEFKTHAPSIEKASIVAVGLTSADLKATINPNAEETTYAFELVSEANFVASGWANATKLPPGGEELGSGAVGVEVEQEVTGLTPRATYHLRVSATNAGGVSHGREIIFTTYSEEATGLPDGRAYEQATPVNKDGANAQYSEGNVRASASGNGILYFISGGLPEAEGSQNLSNFISLRGPEGWSTQGLFAAAKYGRYSRALGLSEDFAVSYMTGYGSGNPFRLFEKSTATAQYGQIFTDAEDAEPEYLATSANDEAALFEVHSPWLPGAAEEGDENLFLWNKASQSLTLAGVFNDGETPEEGALGGPWDWYNSGGGGSTYYTQELHVLSADADRLFFTDAGTDQLYVRENPLQPQSAMSGEECTEPAMACTYEVSESQRATADPAGPQPADFLTANEDGSVVYFMSKAELTEDAETGPNDNSNDLYRYETASHTLTDLTPSTAAENPNGEEVAGVLGASRNGSRVYFAAGGVLAAGATPGHCKIGNNEPGTCNVYLWEEGATEPIRFVTQLTSENGAGYNGYRMAWNWAPAESGTGSPHTARVSANGDTLVFSASNDVSSYESGGQIEFYRYEIGDPHPSCLSCLPSGEVPTTSATFGRTELGLIAPSTVNASNPRGLSANGNRLFFQTSERLLGADTNGVEDVYEWEADGEGSCSSTDQNGGCLYLISTGTSPLPSYFADSGESGNDAFFYTVQPLVGQDKDQLVDLYDARVGGGLASQNPPPASLCTGEACRPAATPAPAAQTPGTSTFSGSPNPKPKEGKHQKKKQHKKQHKKKHHKKKHNRKRHQGATKQGGKR